MANNHLDSCPRRSFLRAMTLPIGASLLTGCGGGGAADAATSSAPQSPTEKSLGEPNVETADPGPSPVRPPVAFGPLPRWVESLPLWQWYEIPNTALAQLDPAVRPLGITGPRSKIEAWCGAALKRDGSVYMIGAAGGHGDYAGNEVNALSLNSESPRWVELRGPSENAAVVNATQFYLDLRPAATHTYYASHFIDSLDRMIVFASQGLSGDFPGAPENFPYTGSSRSFSFDYSKLDWDSPDYIAKYPGRGDYIAALCTKHPWTGDVYYSRNSGSGWYRWTSSSNTWTRLSNVTRAPWYAGSAIDPVRERILVVGGYGRVPAEIRGLDGSKLSAGFGGAESERLRLSGYPGVIYDEVADVYVVLHNADGRINVTRVDAKTLAVDVPPMSGVPPAERPNGIHNAVQYVPELRGFVIASSHYENVRFVRTMA